MRACVGSRDRVRVWGGVHAFVCAGVVCVVVCVVRRVRVFVCVCPLVVVCACVCLCVLCDRVLVCAVPCG